MRVPTVLFALLITLPSLAQEAPPVEAPPTESSTYGFGFASSHDIRGRTVVLGTLPGETSDLRAGDIVLSVNGERLEPNVPYSRAFYDAEDNAPAALAIIRGLDTLTVSADTLSYLQSTLRRVQNASGCLTGDCMDGYGVRIEPNGQMYAGGWKEGLHHGSGMLTDADGETYAGGFDNGRRHGESIHTWPNGASWVTAYDLGDLITPGVYTDSLGVSRPVSPPRYHSGFGVEIATDTTGRYILMGVMPGGAAEQGGLQPHDAFLAIDGVALEPFPTIVPFHEAATTPPATFTVARGADTLTVSLGAGPYEVGELRRAARAFRCEGDCVNGYGVRVKPDGLRYEGEWADGLLHGSGTLYDLNGTVYTGEFIMDRRWGHGILRWPDGATWEGEFEYHVPKGDGLYTDSEGNQSSGYPEER